MIIRRYVDDVGISDFQTFSQFVHNKCIYMWSLLKQNKNLEDGARETTCQSANQRASSKYHFKNYEIFFLAKPLLELDRNQSLWQYFSTELVVKMIIDTIDIIENCHSTRSTNDCREFLTVVGKLTKVLIFKITTMLGTTTRCWCFNHFSHQRIQIVTNFKSPTSSSLV